MKEGEEGRIGNKLKLVRMRRRRRRRGYTYILGGAAGFTGRYMGTNLQGYNGTSWQGAGVPGCTAQGTYCVQAHGHRTAQ